MTNVTRQVETANPVWVCSSKHLDREWYSTLFHKRLLVCSGQRWLVSFWWLIFDEVKTSDIAKSRPVQVMKELKESGICALFITVAWTSELLWDRLRLWLLLGALHYIVNYDENLLLTYNRQTKGTNNVSFLKTTEIALTNNKNQLTETKVLTQKQLQFIKNSGTPSIAPAAFHMSFIFSTVATVMFNRPSRNYFLGKNAKMTHNLFLLLSIGYNEENNGKKSVLCWWVAVWGYWLGIESRTIARLNVTKTAGSMSYKMYRFSMMLEVCCSSIEQSCWSLPGMHLGFSKDLEMFFCFCLLCPTFLGASQWKVIAESKSTYVTIFTSWL